MRKLIIPLLLLIASISHAQINVNNVLNSVITGTGGTSISNQEVVSGLKEALTIGSKNSTVKASALDGFYKNPAIKIPFPPEAKEMDQTLRNLGMSKQVDQFVKTLNRAAEEAAKDAAPIFVSAITNMSIGDGITILKGADNAATAYLQNQTTPQLKAQFKPKVAAALNKVQITKYWNPLAKKYNKLPLAKKMNPDLEAYVTDRAIQGLFKLVADEELKIRKDPAARVTDILKKVFGFN